MYKNQPSTAIFNNVEPLVKTTRSISILHLFILLFNQHSLNPIIPLTLGGAHGTNFNKTWPLFTIQWGSDRLQDKQD